MATRTGTSNNDTFLISKSDGNVEIQNTNTNSSFDIVKFTDVLPSEIISVTRDLTNDNLVLKYGTSQLTIFRYFGEGWTTGGGVPIDYTVSQIQFSDNTIWNKPALASHLSPVLGTLANDTVYGFSDWAENINGLDGNDYIDGKAGNDTLNGGIGVDTIWGGLGADSILGGDGNDNLYAGNSDSSVHDLSSNTVDGGAGDDVIFSGYGADSLSGGDGVDNIQGQASSSSTQDGGAGNDALNGGAGADSLNGGIGDDNLFGGLGNDVLNGGDGIDHLEGGDGNDIVNGGAGDDTLFSGIGNDVLNGGDGNDNLQGQNSTNSTQDGGAGNDTVYGGVGADSLSGGDGNDQIRAYITASIDTNINTLIGGGGDDSLYGANGNDILNGGVGKDYMNGGAGDDVYYVDNLNDTIIDYTGNNTVHVSIDAYKVPDGVTAIYDNGAQALPYFINTLYSGLHWGDIGQAQSLNYSFATTPEAGLTGFALYTPAQQEAVRTALSKYSSIAGVTFTEVVDNANVQLRFFRDDLSSHSGAAGYAGLPTDGNVHILTGTVNGINYDDLSTGSYGFEVLIHEIGHALGLKHSFEGVAGVSILEPSQDNTNNTVMSYTHAGANLVDTAIFDKASIHYIYGVNSTARATNDTYHLSDRYIWDGAGTDTISASEQTQSVYLNLNAGSWIYAGAKDSSILAANQAFIGFGTTIENATGGSGNDTLIGNSGNNILDGSGGTDTAICSSWTTCDIAGNSTSATITDLTGVNGTDTLRNVEKLTLNGVTVTTEQAVNDAPVGVADNNASDAVIEAGLNVVGDSIAIGNVLNNDTDADSALGLGETKIVKTVNNQISNVGTAVNGLYGSLTLLANGSYTYSLDNNKTATDALSTGQTVFDTFNYTVVDAHGATSAATALSISIAGTNDTLPVNTVPTAANKTITFDEDNTYTFSAADFGYADAEGSPMASIKIANLPVAGLLKLGGVAVTVNQVITTAAIANLTFTPAANGNGTGYAAFDFTVNDGSLNSVSANHISFNITAINDAPVLVAPTAISYVDTVFDDTFVTATGTLAGSDVDGNALTYGITGGTDHGLTVSKSSTYGVLTVTKATGGYSFVANDAAIEPLTIAKSASFSVTVADGLLSNSKNLVVNITQNGITESVGNDSLTGTSGNDSFNALAGVDTTTGGLGNDSYVVDNIGDVIVETSTLASEIDSVKSWVSYTLSANVENLTLNGTTAINGIGNGVKNILTGNTAANSLSGGLGADKLLGGAGNDTLIGGNGKDTLTGGLGADVFKFTTTIESGVTATGRDIITDFKTAQADKIDLSTMDADTTVAGNGAFTSLSLGGVFSGTFASHAALYLDQTNHILYGNNDGDTAADFSIALTGVTTLTTSDFIL